MRERERERERESQEQGGVNKKSLSTRRIVNQSFERAKEVNENKVEKPDWTDFFFGPDFLPQNIC